MAVDQKHELKNGTLVTIKRVLVEDYERDGNYEFVYEWLSKVSEYIGYDFPEEALEENKARWLSILARLDEVTVIGALDDNGRIVGYVDLYVESRNAKMQHVGRWGIAIHPNYQNKGLGTKLLEILEGIARTRVLIRLEASIYEGNEIAKHLYVEKFGYAVEGRSPLSLRLSNGSYADRILIGKILSEGEEMIRNG